MALPAGYRLTDDAAEINVEAAHAFLATSYWSPGIPLDTVRRAIAGSFCIAIMRDDRQIAFARVITDHATFAYLADVYVLDAHRGRGLAKAMLSYLQDHPRLQGLRRWLLFTRDAQSLYATAGWSIYG
ncbi:MAG: GNAT family N-acetyltransferase, partial [Sphingomonadaceae bacterium]|nr:GNAT family N-acetyltransferase [Sphingomonadaceae bacterium]